jgi:tetratricopeptide (TPR) repeat protein
MERDELELTSYKNKQVSEEELKNLEALLVESPEDTTILDWVAFAQYCSGNYDRSVELYRRCIDREPQTASYYYFLGNALYKQQKTDEAVAAWEMASSLDRQGLFRKKAQDRLTIVKGRSQP